MNDLLEKPTNLSTASKYTAMNGLIYLTGGVLLIVWAGLTQTLFMDRAFVGDEQGLIRVIGLTVVDRLALPLWRSLGRTTSCRRFGGRPINIRCVHRNQ
jgi:hypothetical protein